MVCCKIQRVESRTSEDDSWEEDPALPPMVLGTQAEYLYPLQDCNGCLKQDTPPEELKRRKVFKRP